MHAKEKSAKSLSVGPLGPNNLKFKQTTGTERVFFDNKFWFFWSNRVRGYHQNISWFHLIIMFSILMTKNCSPVVPTPQRGGGKIAQKCFEAIKQCPSPIIKMKSANRAGRGKNLCSRYVTEMARPCYVSM